MARHPALFFMCGAPCSGATALLCAAHKELQSTGDHSIEFLKRDVVGPQGGAQTDLESVLTEAEFAARKQACPAQGYTSGGQEADARLQNWWPKRLLAVGRARVGGLVVAKRVVGR